MITLEARRLFFERGKGLGERLKKIDVHFENTSL
jgi:hypothetical protein